MTQIDDRALTRRRLLRTALTLPLAALATACELAVPGQGPPPVLYRLTPKSTFSEDLPRVDWQLILEVPVADAGLNTTRVALLQTPTQLEYYARSSWTDRAPLMVQTLMIESFENSGRIVSRGDNVPHSGLGRVCGRQLAGTPVLPQVDRRVEREKPDLTVSARLNSVSASPARRRSPRIETLLALCALAA